MDAWQRFLRAHATVLRVLERELAEERDLPLTWYDVLLQLNAAGGRLRMSELADSLLISRSATTRFVDRLETRGLLTREPCHDDRRGTYVVLTPTGKRTLREAAPVHLRGIDQHFGRLLTDDEARVLAETMGKLLREHAPTT
jgi:DNA-binding MarR family transcriptional regulator